MKIELKARAKINLSLEILGRMGNGYHNLLSIMQSVDLYDKIVLEKCGDAGIDFGCSIKELDGSDNLCCRSANLFFEESGIKGGCKIFLEKKIPTEAGMAGGSTDAAAVLVGLNEICGRPFSQERLHKLAKRLGADVPFCLYGGTSKAEGIGDLLLPLPTLDLRLLIIKPTSNVSTKEVFSVLGREDYSDGSRTLCAVRAIEQNDKEQLFLNMFNGMYRKSLRFAPEMEEIIHRLEQEFGSARALMSGSGSTVFAIFEDEKKMNRAWEYFSKRYEKVYKTQTAGESVTMLRGE